MHSLAQASTCSEMSGSLGADATFSVMLTMTCPDLAPLVAISTTHGISFHPTSIPLGIYSNSVTHDKTPDIFRTYEYRLPTSKPLATTDAATPPLRGCRECGHLIPKQSQPPFG